MSKVYIKIDGKKYAANPGESVLQVAIRNNIDIPHFCYHEDLPIDANCRTCLVEQENEIKTSCQILAKNGVDVKTNTSKVRKLRKQNMELLLANYKKNSPKAKKGYYSQTLEKLKKYGIDTSKYKREPVKQPIHKMGTAAQFDPALCIDCNKCVEICEHIGICFLKLEGKNSKTRITYNKDPKVDCIYCGQCTVHCPVEAVREQSHIDGVEKALKDPKKTVIVQTAPSVRTSIGEEFGLPPGTNLTTKLFTAYRKLGFDKVFDVNMGADITTMVEAEELVERIKKNKPLPMFTSCCPGWVKYVEFYHPELFKYLTTARSPQMHSGGAYKFWWAKKMGIDPKNVVVVSTMPCTSKKYEALNKEMYINGIAPVDYSLTTRELAVMLKKHKIDLPKLKPGKLDHYGIYSGAAAIYGASGGVMESALRTAYHMLTGKDMPRLEIKKVRGIEGIKKAYIKIGGKTLKVAIAATPKNAAKIIEELKKDPNAYHYIEVMACPGGCIGGGGQPIPSTMKIVAKRIEGLYKIDSSMKMRKAHENPIVKEYMDFLETQPKKLKHELLHRGYSKKKKFE